MAELPIQRQRQRLSAYNITRRSNTEKLDSLQKDVTDLKVDMAEVKTELKIIDRRLEKVEGTQNALIKDVSDLKGAKSLIIPVVVAVLTSILTLLVRSIPNP